MTTFNELGIAPEIVRAIEELGFEQPMPVQEQVIPLLLKEATDIVALAKTGTGKTAAFGLPIIQQIDTKNQNTQALILCPTRELCLQITDDLNDYSKYVDGIRILPVYGGSSIETQINALRKGVHIIVATPGRLIDLLNRRAAKLSNVSKAVLDEAVDPDGGVIYEGSPEGVHDSDKHWWPQAEAVVGFLNAWQISGQQHFLDAAIHSWEFIDKFIVDHENGEWFWLVSRAGVPGNGHDKVGPWKCPYHNSRTCFEVMERLDALQHFRRP